MTIIQQIGSYAGFAAVVGLAVLGALYFSQARDVKRLREWAGRTPERMPSQVPYPTPAARPAPRPVPAAQPPAPPAPPRPVTPAAGGQPAPARAAEAGAAPPALSQDTMSHPPPAPSPSLAPPGLGGHFAREAQLEREREVAEDDRAEDDLAEDDLEDEELEGDRLQGDGPDDEDPADEASDMNGRYEDDDELDHEVDDPDEEGGEAEDATGEQRAGGSPGPARPLPPPPVSPRPASPPSPITASRRPLPPRPAPPRKPQQGPILPPYEKSRPGAAAAGPGRSSRGKVLGVGAAALLVAVVAFGVLQLTGGDDGPKGSAEQPPPAEETPGGDAPPAKSGAKPAVVPAQVTVAVLNGTTVGGLAAELGEKLEGQGFQLGNVTNNTDQERAESVVLFTPGAEAEAAEVGKRLKIDQREPVDPDSQTRAGDASVVVVAGADLNK